VLVAAGVVVGHLVGPRTEGVQGDWSARSAPGTVVGGRALVSRTNSALDLHTGTTVTLGSVTGGTPYVADDRLLIVTQGRLDSVRLDASARWTWRAPGDATVVPLAASAGRTMVASCPASGAEPSCRLVGLDPRGQVDWQSTTSTRPRAPMDGALPRAHADPVDGGGLLLTDPATGRQSLVPGSTFVAVPDGPVVVAVEQDGQCVVSATNAADPEWTRVLGPCPGGALPRLSTGAGSVRLDWPARSRALELATGKDSAVTPPLGPGELARTSELVATRRDLTVRTDLLHWGDTLHSIELHPAGGTPGGDPVARVVSAHGLDLLLLEPQAVVVRDGTHVVRYTLDRASATLGP
jgi:hypothetical protein